MYIEPDLEFESEHIPWTPENIRVPVDMYFAADHFYAAPEEDDE